MCFLASIILVWGIITAHALASPRGIFPRQLNLNATISLPPPTQDPWYHPPQNWTLTTPGTVLKTRNHAYGQINIGHCNDTFQVLYTTADSNNNLSWAVTTIFIPTSHTLCNSTNLAACSHAIVSYQVPYDSADPDATPSYLLQWGEPYGEMNDLLARGYFVAVPDYEGPLGSYCAGVQAGHATIDGVRAVLQVAPDLRMQTEKIKVALWGYSGGAQATEFAAELAGMYAPELKVAGAVVGGPSPNLTTVGEKMNGKDTAGLLIAGIVGITSQHLAAREFLLSRLHKEGPYNATAFMSATTMSGVQVLLAFMGQDVYKYFLNGSADLYAPIMQEMTNRDGVMGYHGTPNMPFFLYKAVNDEMSPANESDILVDGYCKAGANILYHRNTIGGHNQELWDGRDRALRFLGTVLDGTSVLEVPTSGCLTVNVTVASNVTLSANGTILVEPLDVRVLENGTIVLAHDVVSKAARNKLGVLLR